jgi:predicted amidophosphoribosyltransferase
MADRFNALIQEELERMSLDETHPYHEEYAYATALFFYRADSDYSHISRQLKYHSNIPAGRLFGQMLGKKIASAEHFADVDAVIPVPLHWTRKWSRGYNQAEIIAREVASILGAELRTDILQRSRRTRTQTKLSIEGKATNVKGAFRVRPDIVQSSGSGTKKADASAISDLKHLLIIDDIFTTGSTALACYSALRDTFPPSVRISIATLGFVGEA